MKYRIVIGYKTYPFKNFSEATMFQRVNGGQLFQLIYSEKYER